MNNEEIREKLLAILQSEQENKNTPFDESKFLDYLIDPKSKPNSPPKYLKSSGQHDRFTDKVELEFGICFRDSDNYRYCTFEKYIEKIKDRLGKKKANILILDQRKKELNQFKLESFLICTITGIAYIVNVKWFAIAILILVGAILIWTTYYNIGERRKIRRLYEKISKEST